MSEKNAGNDPAYPVIGVPGAQQDYPGLTKRELFAAMAMQGFAADPNCSGEASVMATCAVSWADALIAELAKDRAA